MIESSVLMLVAKETTKTRILGATERLVAERGFEAVSLRDITSEAGVNVAAVNYHFGCKEKLFEAVQCRYINPVNKERLRMLEEITAGGQTAEVRQILEAFMRPFFSMVTSSPMSEQLFFKLMGRCISDQQSALPEDIMPEFQRVVKAFTSALLESMPGMPVQLILWRLHYTFGVMAHTLLHGDMLKKLTGGASGELDIENQLQGMIDFCHAGFLTEKGVAE